MFKESKKGKGAFLSNSNFPFSIILNKANSEQRYDFTEEGAKGCLQYYERARVDPKLTAFFYKSVTSFNFNSRCFIRSIGRLVVLSSFNLENKLTLKIMEASSLEGL